MLTKQQKINQLGIQLREKAKIKYYDGINRINANNPMFEIISTLVNKNHLPEDKNPEIKSQFKKKSRNLPFSTKKMTFEMLHNWQRQPYKIQRCTICQIDIPGPQEIIHLHMQKHFKKSEGEEVETHPYKS